MQSPCHEPHGPLNASFKNAAMRDHNSSEFAAAEIYAVEVWEEEGGALLHKALSPPTVVSLYKDDIARILFINGLQQEFGVQGEGSTNS